MESKSFTLPSTPKLKKSNFSSSLISGATKLSPKINTSRIRISRPALARRINIEALVRKTNPESITRVNPQQSSIENTLVETNKILVEIQKQLALDFAMRAREEKEERDTIRRDESRKKLKAEESLLEKSARKLGKGIKKTTDKIISPIKNVFDQILNFLTLVGAGIAANAAFEWLKDPENRKQLDEWFGWVADNWQWVAGITAGVLLLEPILSLVGAIGGAIAIIRSGFDIFTFIRNRLFGGAKTPPGGKPPGGSKKPPGGSKPPGGVKSPNFKPPQIGPRTQGPTAAGSNFQLQQAREALTKSGNKFKPTAPVTLGGGLRGLAMGALGRGLLLYSLYEQTKIVFNPKDNIITALGDLGTSTYNTFQTDPNKKILFDVPEGGGRRSMRNERFNQRILEQREGVEQGVEGVEPREMGGPITAGKPYLVGEGGPELVVPKISGTVINNMKTEKIYQMISSDIGEGKINMIELPPITNQLPPPEIPVPSGPASEVPDISSINIADPYRILSPSLYGITV